MFLFMLFVFSPSHASSCGVVCTSLMYCISSLSWAAERKLHESRSVSLFHSLLDLTEPRKVPGTLEFLTFLEISLKCGWDIISRASLQMIKEEKKGEGIQMRRAWPRADSHCSWGMSSGGFTVLFCLLLHKFIMLHNKHQKQKILISFILQSIFTLLHPPIRNDTSARRNGSVPSFPLVDPPRRHGTCQALVQNTEGTVPKARLF